MKTVQDLLNTRNKREQAERVQALLQAAQAPVVDLVIRFDGRRGQVVEVSTVGGRVSFEESLVMLEQARSLLMARAAQAIKPAVDKTPVEGSPENAPAA